jgi:hypothetical protein
MELSDMGSSASSGSSTSTVRRASLSAPAAARTTSVSCIDAVPMRLRKPSICSEACLFSFVFPVAYQGDSPVWVLVLIPLIFTPRLTGGCVLSYSLFGMTLPRVHAAGINKHLSAVNIEVRIRQMSFKKR